jgi:hypothetical protein
MIRSPLRSPQAQGITPSDSRKSQNQICKKIAFQTAKPGKYDYFDIFNHPVRSMASRNFTGDYSAFAGSAIAIFLAISPTAAGFSQDDGVLLSRTDYAYLTTQGVQANAGLTVFCTSG